MEDEDQEYGRLAIGILIGLVVIGAILFSPIFSGGIADRAPSIIAMNNVKQLLLGCGAFAADNKGEYPPSLEALFPDYIDYEPNMTARSEDGVEKDYFYFSGFTDTSESRTPLIVHPFTFDGRVVVGYTGGHVTSERQEDLKLSQDIDLEEFE